MKLKLTSLIVALIPSAVASQSVELKSPDGFISVEGEIVSFNGVMVKVQTSVGVVNVPAADVLCYGDGCIDGIERGDTGQSEQTLFAEFSDDGARDLFNGLVAALASTPSKSVKLTNADSSTATFETNDGSQAIVNFDADNTADAPAFTVGNEITAQGYANAAEWAGTTTPTTQLIASKPYAVIVSDNVEIDSISVEQLAEIFAGDINNWSQLGGPDQNIFALRNPDGSRSTQDLLNSVMAPNGASISSQAMTVSEDRDLVKFVSDFPNSVAVVSAGLDQGVRTVPIRNSCGDTVASDDFSNASSSYPLIGSVFVQHPADATSEAAVRFFDFASNPGARDRIEDAGYFGPNIMREQVEKKSGRIQALLSAPLSEDEKAIARLMMQTMISATRTSLTFTAGQVTAIEAARNRANFVQLRDAMEAGDFAGNEIVFAGFAGGNTALPDSETAANNMMEAFRLFASDTTLLPMSAIGFGGVGNVACTPDQGDNKVQVWLQPTNS